MTIKRADTPRKVFTFTVDGGEEVFTVEDLEAYPHVQPIYENWLTGQMDYERDWRNWELSETDWMLIPDATFNGELIAGSPIYDIVIAWRQALRDYDLRLESRPIKPNELIN